ncbi:hypothetical protein DE146DRAFT_632733 [Phaeosphaeria sp. MPI-PUGE-AT-0046c]|nr:hypothetical protein DE146DRAFT_632733 [Phaeosphaeria sp. MPI-PUGE-AT-0046c]
MTGLVAVVVVCSSQTTHSPDHFLRYADHFVHRRPASVFVAMRITSGILLLFLSLVDTAAANPKHHRSRYACKAGSANLNLEHDHRPVHTGHASQHRSPGKRPKTGRPHLTHKTPHTKPIRIPGPYTAVDEPIQYAPETGPASFLDTSAIAPLSLLTSTTPRASSSAADNLDAFLALQGSLRKSSDTILVSVPTTSEISSSSTSALGDDAAALALQALRSSSTISISVSSSSSSIRESQQESTASSLSVEAPLASSDAANVLPLATAISSGPSSTLIATSSVSATQLAPSSSVVASSSASGSSSSSETASSSRSSSSRSESLSTSISATLSSIYIPSSSSESTLITSSASESSSAISISVTTASLSVSVVSSCVEPSPTPTACLLLLPPQCAQFGRPDVLNAILTNDDVQGCLREVGLPFYQSASPCFSDDPLSTTTGDVALRCLESRLLCTTCASSLPWECTNLFSNTEIINVDLLEECQTTLGVFSSGVSPCFQETRDNALTGVNIGACLQAAIPQCTATKVCPDVSSSSLSAIVSSSSSIVPVGVASPLPVCSGQLPSSPPGTCVTTLPEYCQAFSEPYSVDSGLTVATLGPFFRACDKDLQGAGVSNAATCFPTGEESLKGREITTCLQSLALCKVCIESLPDVCTSFFSSTQAVDGETLSACKTAVGTAGQGQGSLCFNNPLDTSPLTGTRVGACLSSIPSCGSNICSSSSSSSPSSSLAQISSSTPPPTPTFATISTPSPQPCVQALPSSCRVASRGLLIDIRDTISPSYCQTELALMRTPNAADVCFTTDPVISLTGQDFVQCLAVYFPECPRCINDLPGSCSLENGRLGSVCYDALDTGITADASKCFDETSLSAPVTLDLLYCIGRAMVCGE